jgi:isoleucyl-tRNA synthetase
MALDLKKIERDVLDFWEKNKIFQKSVENRKGQKPFVWFEGPPTANGLPGIHHLLARVYKDIFCRYKTMQGFYVLRKGGWDTHGLPVEIQVEKELGLKNKKEVEEYGIAKFNKKARESVWKYLAEWEKFTREIGFWVDMDDPYVTYDPKYMESLWNIISEIDKRGLLYKDFRVVPYCSHCGTPLSSHEVALGYKEVEETAVYIKFRVKGTKDTYILSWTTTPWTLPGNVALAVGADIDYIKVEVDDEKLILAKARYDALDLKGKIIEEMKGKDLVGTEYDPLFDIPQLQSDTSYKVYPADFVTIEDGSGVVHTAVMYGVEDFDLGMEVGLPKVHTVNEDGKFEGVGYDLDGLWVKSDEVEEKITEYLEENNFLFKSGLYTHDYPFCWRCDSPLLYYATDSWFVRMTAVKDQLLKNNQEINWIPSHIKEGRFGEWLDNVRDWAFSRNRFWGTPLPIWACEECEHRKVIGSLEELEKNSFKKKNTFYGIRHGFSEKNVKTNYVASKLEHDTYNLLPEGKEQVQKEAERLEKEGGIDLVYTSPFKRTKQTAEIIAKHFEVDIIEDDRLFEIDHGSVCEGKTHFVCLSEGQVPDMDTKFGDGESWNTVKKRTMDAMKEINATHEGKKILIVSHGDPLWVLNGALHNYTSKEILEKKDELYSEEGEAKILDYKNYPYNDDGDLDLHRPYVDDIELKCEKCEGKLKRIEDVADVWFDSGAMPYAQWHYPFENKEIFKEQFPADYIAEGVDQTRGWFYTLVAVATVLGLGPAFKNVISHGLVLDEKGKKMSKSKGNVIKPDDVMDKFGADTVRWYFYTLNPVGESKLFSLRDVESKMKGFIMTLMNSVRFLELYHKGNGGQVHGDVGDSILDKWIVSRLNTVIHGVTESMEKYDATTAGRIMEEFATEDISKWWIRRSRERFQNPSSDEDYEKALKTLRFVLLELDKLIAPFTPFLAEHLHIRLHPGSSPGTESVHLHDWPGANKKVINEDLEKKMIFIRDAVTQGLAIRKEKQIKVRQPLAKFHIKSNQFGELESALLDLVKDELNVKEVTYEKADVELEVDLDLQITSELRHEGWAREFARQIQEMRKEAGYQYDQEVFAKWHTEDEELAGTIEKHSDSIAKKNVLYELVRGSLDDEKAYDIEREFDIDKGKKIQIAVRK